MANVDGGVLPILSTNGDNTYKVKANVELVKFGTGDFAKTPRTYYRMRGWNTNTLAWEAWTSADEPSTTPPVGPCESISITSEWS